MSAEPKREAARVREVYARRAERGLDSRYDYWLPANLFIHQGRERALIAALDDAALLPLTGRRILDAGCGNGAVLHDMQRYGAQAQDLCGVDLLPDRVDRARELLPGADIEVADAQSLPHEDAAFDVVLGFTLLSSVLDETIRQRIAAAMTRVTKPGGLIVLYDFWTNPTNRDARPLRRDDVRRLFSGHPIAFRGVTLAPPLVRTLIGLPGGRLACSALEVLPFLRTHFIAAVRI
ncbi:MAG: methyltransferase domain-containing protein [Dehalococcoidia bacterium]|nr:methyltransferase domain-containing protein [Dehalococcoidia bacterium]